jgi:CheY-like chemotaxis protein
MFNFFIKKSPGIHLLTQNYYDVVFIDMAMPGSNGLGMVQEVRRMIGSKIVPDLCLVLCTALENEEEKIQCLNSGADGFLAKPFTHKNLSIALEDAFTKFKERSKQKLEIKKF